MTALSYWKSLKRPSAHLKMSTRMILFFFVAILFGLLIKISDNGSVDEQPAAEFLDQEF